MVLKSKEYYEKTRHVKNNDKSKMFVLRGQRNKKYHEKILSNIKKSYNFVNFPEDYNRYRAENFSVH